MKPSNIYLRHEHLSNLWKPLMLLALLTKIAAVELEFSFNSKIGKRNLNRGLKLSAMKKL